MNTPTSKKIIAPILIASTLAIAACQDKDVPEEQTTVEVEELITATEIEEAPELVIEMPEEESGEYDFNDPATWGEPTGFDSEGNPTGYRRVMPNGNIRTATPFHGEPTSHMHVHPLHEDSYPEKMKYKHWHKNSLADPLPVVSCVDGRWAKSVSKYISVWNQSPFISLVAQPHPLPGLSGTDCFDNEVPGAITVTNFDYSEKWAGEKIVAYAGYAFGDHDADGHILWGLVTLNDGKDWFDEQVNTPDVVDAWRDMTVCHEMGHTLGLGHNDENKDTVTGTCMDYSRTPFPNLLPDAHDFEHMAEAYDHTHGEVGVSCKIGEAMDQSPDSKALYGIISADDFFKTPNAPERKTAGAWVAVKNWSGSEIGSMISVDQFRPALFDEQEYFVHEEMSEHGFGVVDPGPNHTYFEAFESELEFQTLVDEHIEQHKMIGLLEDCTEWKVHLPDLLWGTSLEYYELNSPELRAKQNEVEAAERQ